MRLSVVFAILLAGCVARSPAEPAHEEWLTQMIARMQSEPATNPPSSIVRYTYRGATVYYRPARCCDVYGELYDANGGLICHPDGGITGNGDGRCSDFAVARTNGQVIWSDTRR